MAFFAPSQRPISTFGLRPSFCRSEAAIYFAFFVTVSLIAFVAFVAFSLYERNALNEPQLAMRKEPYATPYYFARGAAILFISSLIAFGLYRLRSIRSTIQFKLLTSTERLAAWALLSMAASCTVLFALTPLLFNKLASEDGAVEWASALLPLAASVAFIHAAFQVKRSGWDDRRRPVTLFFCSLFAVGLFLIGMEEISWMQRIFEIETPAMFTANQQQEMNLHNMHSIVIGQTHKAIMFAALVVLPFIVDTAPRNRLFDWLSDFLPGRSILAISAPWVAFNYNEWNFMASQMYVALTLMILICYMRAAIGRRDFSELAIFGSLALFVLIAQPVFLILGHLFVRRWDASEYVELFMALGLTFYTWQTLARVRARYRRTCP